MTNSLTLLVGTRKGAFTLKSDANRQAWTLSDPQFLGHIIYHVVPDPRNKAHILMAAKTGHLGPTVYHSKDGGLSFQEARKPPAFPKAKDGEQGRVVDVVFWLSPGHKDDIGRWYAGTSVPGLFVSDDHGDTWEPVSGFNDGPDYPNWTSIGPTPGGHLVHSICIHPQNKKQMYLGISVGGTFETQDGGLTWSALNLGVASDFIPEEDPEYGHDPHCMVLHPAKPDRLYQQNHCGIYRLDRPDKRWQRIGNNMPKDIGDIGFPIVVHPEDANTAWVFPMDGSSVWPRTSPEGKPAVYVTRDGGMNWQRQDKGLPQENAYFTVKRQAMAADDMEKVGIYFGTSQGEVWASQDEGNSWRCIASYLPEIFSINTFSS